MARETIGVNAATAARKSTRRVNEEVLDQAIDRILANAPNDEALRQLVAKGALRLSISNVARESGCSRTLIGFEGCKYPAARARILKLKAETVGRTLSDEVARLRGEVSVLELEIQSRDTAYAELLIRMSEMGSGRLPSGRPIAPQCASERRAQMAIVGGGGRDERGAGRAELPTVNSSPAQISRKQRRG